MYWNFKAKYSPNLAKLVQAQNTIHIVFSVCACQVDTDDNLADILTKILTGGSLFFDKAKQLLGTPSKANSHLRNRAAMLR